MTASASVEGSQEVDPSPGRRGDNASAADAVALARRLFGLVAAGRPVPDALCRDLAQAVLDDELHGRARAVVDTPPELVLRRALELAVVVVDLSGARVRAGAPRHV